MNLLNQLYTLKTSLYSKTLNLKNIKKQIDQITRYKQLTSYDYLNALLHPETIKNVKIPSKVPIASACFHFNQTVQIKTNKHGCMVVYFNPDFLLSSEIEYEKMNVLIISRNGTVTRRPGYSIPWGTFSSNIQAQLTGNEVSDSSYSPEDAGQSIPPFYSSYRLVSGCMSIKYLGSTLDAAGTIGGAVVNNDWQYLSGRYYYDDKMNPFDPNHISYALKIPADDFTDFKNIRNCINSQEYNCLDGLRLLYYPLDNSYKEFTKLFDGNGVSFKQAKPGTTSTAPVCIVEKDFFKGGFTWVAYAYNVTPFSKFLCTIDLNFECLLNPKYESILPTTIDTYDMTPQEECDVIQKVRLNAVQKLIK